MSFILFKDIVVLCIPNEVRMVDARPTVHCSTSQLGEILATLCTAFVYILL